MLTESETDYPDILIYNMTEAGQHSETNFKEAVMKLVSAFSERSGKKYIPREYSNFLKKLSYHEGLVGSNPYIYKWSLEHESLEENLKKEQGLYNALEALNYFLAVLNHSVQILRIGA